MATSRCSVRRIHRRISDMRLRWIALNARIADLGAGFTDATRADGRRRRLLTIPSIGALNATALVATVGDARTFGRGRDLAAWLGLVPQQAMSAGKPRLLDITKRGSRYLRNNLIQGARASLPTSLPTSVPTLSKSDTHLGAWFAQAAVACAPKHRRDGFGSQDGGSSGRCCVTSAIMSLPCWRLE